MADILKEMREKIAELEKSVVNYKEKYINKYTENYANEQYIKDVKKYHK